MCSRENDGGRIGDGEDRKILKSFAMKSSSEMTSKGHVTSDFICHL